MTYGHFMTALEMWKCSEKHPVARPNNSNTKKVVIDRWSTKDNLSVKQFSTILVIYYNILNPIIGSRG